MKAGRAIMPASRINWSAFGTFLFVLFVLGVLAFENMGSPAETTQADDAKESDVPNVAVANETPVRQ